MGRMWYGGGVGRWRYGVMWGGEEEGVVVHVITYHLHTEIIHTAMITDHTHLYIQL